MEGRTINYLNKEYPLIIRLLDCVSDDMHPDFDRKFWVEKGNKYLSLQLITNQKGKKVYKLEDLSMRYKLHLEQFVEEYGFAMGVMQYIIHSEIECNNIEGGFPAKLFKQSRVLFEFQGEMLSAVSPSLQLFMWNKLFEENEAEQLAILSKFNLN